MAKRGRKRSTAPAAAPPPETRGGDTRPRAPRAAIAVGVVALAAVAAFFLFRSQPPPPAPPAETPSGPLIAGVPGYIDNAVCAGCHAEIAATWAETGMGRAFYSANDESMAHLPADTSFHHAKSGRSYRIERRDGAYYLRRHETAEDGSETNVFEKRIDYVMGSGNKARSYLHRYPSGKLVELPLGWYSENGGYLAMSPAYDQPVHGGFRREIAFECMSCHNGYFPIEPGSDAPGRDPLYPGPLAEGIGCQRCHGPGRAHVEAVANEAPEATIREAVFNPANASRERPARSLLAMSPRIDRAPAAVLHPALRPRRFLLPPRGAADRFRAALRSPRRSARGQVRDRPRRLPLAQVGLLRAQRDDLHHLSRPAPSLARCGGARAVQRNLQELPRRRCARARSRPRRRDRLHRLSHAPPPRRRTWCAW